MEIQGIVALVTGGASGLGEAIVRRLSAGGAGHVVIMDLNTEKGDALAAELGDNVSFIRSDVTSPESVTAAVEHAKTFGPLRATINCAGIAIAKRTINRAGVPHDLDAFRKIIEVNLIGTFNVLRLSASAMALSEPLEGGERGVIINTASVAAYDGQIGQVAYAASKGGIVGLTLPTARDLSAAGIRVMTMAPGIFETPLLGSIPEKARTALAKTIPFPSRFGQPDEIARLVEAIITNPYLNGETIRIDGSLRMPPR